MNKPESVIGIVILERGDCYVFVFILQWFPSLIKLGKGALLRVFVCKACLQRNLKFASEANGHDTSPFLE